MKAYALLVLVILGHLCQIQAATLSQPTKSTDDATKLLTAKLVRSLVEHRKELTEAFKTLETSANNLGDETDEQAIPAVIPLIIEAVVSGAVGAGVAAAINKG